MMGWLRRTAPSSLHFTGAALLVFVITISLAEASEDRGSFSANDVDFLNLVGNLEGPRGFGTITDFAPAPPPAELDKMPIRDVLAWQRKIRGMGAKSSAAGRYQFIYPTLVQVVDEYGISKELIFDSEMQTYLARLLMADCGFYEVDAPTEKLGNCLARRWAALPLLEGPGAGLSAYAGDGLNRHLVSSSIFRKVLESRFRW